MELREFVFSEGESNEIRVYAVNKAVAKAKIQRIFDDRMRKFHTEFQAQQRLEYEREQKLEQARIDNLDWKTAYCEALEALRVYNSLLADKIDKDMK